MAGVTKIDSEESITRPSIYDVLDEIKTKQTRLEERIEENHRNILTFSQMAESARSDASKAIGGVNALDEQLELVREDIVFLDEKVSALEEAKLPQNITINIANINVLDLESVKALVESITKGRE
ncbi:hypothetical protein [Bacillus cereus group sp. TH253LC]|uniref:hypothetical protein n=1 Tax=Bacillus cereus group sp. TH253LC TaxID=3018043 RepID=UPI0022E863AB|nr:hypothetical protein [Bacillus cereus group sp. TH253LC]MDA1545838.1 hypothetical protein [Bacillus cereus group sp. TH253LC]